MRLDDLAVLVLHQVGAVAVQDARRAGRQRRGVATGLDAVTAGLDADQARLLVRDVVVKDAHGVAAATDTGDHGVGLTADHLRHLHHALLADHRIEIAHHHRIRVRTGHGADDVERALDVGDPVAHGLVERVLERLAAALHRHHGGAKQLHAKHIRRLAGDVLAAHVNDALHAVAGRHGGRGHAVLASASLGNDALLAHATSKQRLADGVVDLVRAGVIKVFALEEDARAASVLGQAPSEVDRAGAPDKVLEFVSELGLKFGVLADFGISLAQFGERAHQRLGDKHTAVGPEVAPCVRQVIHLHCEPL